MEMTKVWVVMDVDGERLMTAIALQHVPRVGEQLNVRTLGMCTVAQVLYAERSPLGNVALYVQMASALSDLPIRPQAVERQSADELRERGWRDFQPQWWTGQVDTSV